MKMLPSFFSSNKERFIQLASILVVVLWIWIQYSLGNKLYAIGILAFLLVAILFRPLRFSLVAILVLVIVVYSTPVIDTWSHLLKAGLNSSQNFRSVLAGVVSPGSGKEVLPGQVKRMLSLMEIHEISEFRLSNNLYSDPLIMQRITEAAWPKRIHNSSPYLFITTDELAHINTCTQIDQRKDIALVHCP